MTDTALNGKDTERLNRYGVRGITRSVFSIFIHLAVLLVSAGIIWWPRAWAFCGMRLILIGIFLAVMIRTNPAVLNARGKKQKDTKPFDKVFFALWMPVLVATPVVTGLDAGRYGWSSVPGTISLAALAVYLGAAALIFWAMAVNAHFEVTVRIQDDRNHQVVSTGPYQYVRHPGYVGVILASAATPLILGSWWGLVPAAINLPLFVFRTALEDRTLRRELPGYAEYAARTRWRLLPGVW